MDDGAVGDGTVAAGTGSSAAYPPARHLLRDLPFELEQVDERRARAHVRLVPTLVTAGRPDLGALMTVTDVLAGSLVGRVLYPDWMATAELAAHLGDDPPTTGDLVVDAAVVRDGRTTVVLDARLRVGGPDGHEVGSLVLTFVRLPRRDTNLDLGSVPVEYGRRTRFGEGDLSVPWTDAVGAAPDPADAGRWRLPVVPYVRNSFGAVNGGVVASLAAACGAGRASAALGVPAAAVDVVVHFLSQGRTGPMAATADIVRSGAGGVACRVEVVDTGVTDGERPDGRSVAVAHVLSTPGSLQG